MAQKKFLKISIEDLGFLDMKVAVFPGSFDPITWGHIDLIKRSLAIFDKVVVLVAKNKSKKYLLSDVERFSLTKDVISSLNF